MGKIYCIIGKSASGKDTVYKRVLEQCKDKLGTICSYTTRPIRDGEQEGVEYHFVDVSALEKLQSEGKVIELRVYHTVYGDWFYFTADDGQIQLDSRDFIMIMTLEGYVSLEKYFGKENIVPIYIEVEDGLRLSRAVERERQQKEPKYKELCRRFIADSEDFAEEKLAEIKNLVRIQNEDIDNCVEQVVRTICGENSKA